MMFPILLQLILITTCLCGDGDVAILDVIDNSLTVNALVLALDTVIENYLEDKLVNSAYKRAILWKEDPTYEDIVTFMKKFELINTDDIQKSLQKIELEQQEGFDDSRETDTRYERFIFARSKHGIITLSIGYSFEKSTKAKFRSFLATALRKFVDKLTNPWVGLLADKGFSEQQRIFVVYHDNSKGYIQQDVSSYEVALEEQDKIKTKLLSSCIMVEDGNTGSKTLYNIWHPVVKGEIVPNFFHYFGIKNSKTKPKTEL